MNIRNLINNYSKDCGCGRKKNLSKTASKDLVGKRFGKLTVLEALPETNKFNRKVYKCRCDCGKETYVVSSSLTTKHTSSCGCLVSYYNSYIANWLKEEKIEYKSEYRICIDNRQYRFDFYLPKYNLFIEYDGSQHYIPTRFFGTNNSKNKELLLKTQERDRIKNQYCKENNINLLRIPYWESKNIKTIISNHLQRLSEKALSQDSDAIV